MLQLAPNPWVVKHCKGGSNQAVTWMTEDRWWLSWLPAWPGAPSALHSGWWNAAYRQGNPRLGCKGCSRSTALLQQPGLSWKCSGQKWCSCRQVWVIPVGSFSIWAKQGLSILHCSPWIPGGPFPFHTAKEPLGKSTWYFSWVRHSFDQNSALSGNALPQLVLGIERFMWRNQINFLSSTRLSIKVWEEKWYNFSIFFFLIPRG